MNRPNWKHYYLKKGQYNDGRERIVIAWFTENGLRKILALPKPEVLKDILIKLKTGTGTVEENLSVKSEENWDSKSVHLGSPK